MKGLFSGGRGANIEMRLGAININKPLHLYGMDLSHCF